MQTRSVKPRIDDQVLLDKFFLDKFIARVVMPAFEQGSLSRKNLSRKNLSIVGKKLVHRTHEQGKLRQETCQGKLGRLCGSLQ